MQPELFQALAQALPGIVYLMDADFGRYLYLNPPVERLLGFPVAQLLEGGPAYMMSRMHPDDLERVVARHKERQAWLDRGGEDVQERYTHIDEYRIQHADGRWIWLRSSAIVFDRHSDGRVKTVLGVAQDISEEKKLGERIRISERMASVGRLAAGMAHEINNPLAHLMGSLELASERLDLMSPSEMRQALREMHDSASRIANLVRDLRGFSRPGDEEVLSPVSLDRIVEASIPLVMNEIRHRARLLRDYEKTPLVMGNEARLGQVFLNLLANAAHAIPDGKVDEHEIRIRLFVGAPGKVVAEVRDTGQGMSPEVLANVFDPFFTTKDVGKGTGLGLSICYHIIRALGGELEVESRPDGGSCFRLILNEAPATELVANAAQLSEENAGDESGGIRGRILIADDDPVVGEVLRAALSGEHEVTVLNTVRECQALIESHPLDYFDLIFCDLIMPQISGMDFFESVRKTRPGLESRFIFITGGAFTAQAEEFLRQAPNQVLFKPFRIQAVRSLARNFIKSNRLG